MLDITIDPRNDPTKRTEIPRVTEFKFLHREDPRGVLVRVKIMGRFPDDLKTTEPAISRIGDKTRFEENCV